MPRGTVWPCPWSRSVDPNVSCTARLPAPTVDAVTREQRDLLRKQIDVRMRERLSAAEQSRRGDARLAKVPRSSDEGEMIRTVAASVRALRAQVG